jgi:hypothetical protein
MSKFTNLPSMPPPPPPPRLNKKYSFKQNFFYLIWGPLPLCGLVLSGTLFFGIPWFSPYKVNPLDYASPSQILNTANERNRLKKTYKLLAQRRTSSPNYLPNNPFGGTNMFGFQVIPEPIFTTPQASALVDDLIPSLEVQTETHEAKIGGRNYNFYLFEFNGKKYWHPYGNIVNYRFGKSDRAKIYQYAEKNFPDRELPEGFGIELDHVIPDTFGTAMSIPRNERVTVFVPQFANAVRTNNRELVDEFTNFDWRLSIDQIMLGGKGGLNTLVKNRLNESIVRNLSLYCFNTQYVTKLKKSNSNINLDIYKAIYPQIASGYDKGYTHDMQYYHVAFCKKFNIAPDDESSIFAFYNELLLEGGERDLEKAKTESMDYFQDLGKDETKIIPEFFISQISEAHLHQYRLSEQIQSFIPSKEYKKYSQKILDLQFRSYEDIIKKILKNFQQSSKYTINTEIAKELLADLQIGRKAEVGNISKQDLFIKIFTDKKNVILGNFYEKNSGTDQLLNLTTMNAKIQDAIVPDKSNIFTLKRDSNPKAPVQIGQTPYEKKMLEKLERLDIIVSPYNEQYDGLNSESDDEVGHLYFDDWNDNNNARPVVDGPSEGGSSDDEGPDGGPKW